MALGLSIISPKWDVLQCVTGEHPCGLRFSDTQNTAIMFSCLAEELGKAISAMQDLHTFL